MVPVLQAVDACRELGSRLGVRLEGEASLLRIRADRKWGTGFLKDSEIDMRSGVTREIRMGEGSLGGWLGSAFGGHVKRSTWMSAGSDWEL